MSSSVGGEMVCLVSNKILSFSSSFFNSFDYDINDSRFILFGHDKNKQSKQASVQELIKQVEHCVLFTTDPQMVDLSKSYICVGNAITKNEKNNNEFFGLKIKVHNNGKIYEQVKDTQSYDKKNNLDYIVEDNTLYTYYDNKYFLDDDGMVNLNTTNYRPFMLFSFDKGAIISETYWTNKEFEENTTGKVRFGITNNGRIITTSLKEENGYSQIGSAIFSNTLEKGYVFLGLGSKDSISNLVINGTWG